MAILSWIVLGLVAGVIAKIILPGKDSGGLITTTVLGVLGAMVGGFVATKMGYGDISGFDLRSFGIALGGSLALLIVWRIVKGVF